MSRILVVEDEPAVRRVVGLVLRRGGYEPVEAGTADEALALLADDVALVLADLSLPGRSGLDLLADLRARRADLPVLLTTGHGYAAEAPDDVPLLPKPFRPAELLDAVRAALG